MSNPEGILCLAYFFIIATFGREMPWMVCFLPLLIRFIQKNKTKKALIKQKIISKSNKRNEEEKKKMIELVKEYIEKDCIVYTINSSTQITGIVKSVTNGGLSIDTGNGIEVINLDYVVRIREFPKNKKGKRKAIVLD